ncbi:MAG TPA: hypothetical protein VGQ44_01465 [Gemmatimonadaceae bacterium]|jgi:hypothetical protein|nr:hypothetical protein [Gemmatimonadaceae bacterium]
MADNRFTWTGLEELKADLRNLPATLAGKGADRVEARANNAYATIHAGYPSRSGDLRNDLTVTHARNQFGATSLVRNSSKHALAFDVGTQARHNKLGANRGSMPANPLFSQTIVQERRRMWSDLKDLLTEEGLTVTGDA